MPALSKTSVVRKEDTKHDWYVVDGDSHIVGRLATQIATVLMGKHKACYTPNVDCGDYVVVINVDRVRFSGTPVEHPHHPYYTVKMGRKTYERYSGYPSGRKVATAIEVWAQRPELILHEAVRRMLPKNKLGRKMLKKLKLYSGPDHPHAAQQPADLPEHLMP